MFQRWAVLLMVYGVAALAVGAAGAKEDKLPILVPGGAFEKGILTREVELPTPGVWYLWLKVRSHVSESAALTWDLDGQQPLKSARAQVLVQPQAGSQWLSYTRYAGDPGFRIEVHVPRAGKRRLALKLLWGKVTVEQIALTLYCSAKPTRDGRTLDHTGDPGGGRARFPISQMQGDGFREDLASPPARATGRAYYVDSARGDDSRDGTSPERAWRSFWPVNARRFEPGEAILLARGGRWEEGLAPQGSGTSEQWITVGAYGEGARPYVNGGKRSGVSLKDQSHWVIQDLQVTNESEDPAQDGISIDASKGKRQPKGIRIINCIAFDTGGNGIHVGSEDGEGNGYDGVVVENCLTFANRNSGIEVGGSDQNGCRNTVIRFCTAYSNTGSAGIWIQSGQNGLIEHCVAYNNACVNIWTWNSINVTIRYCEAYRGRRPADAAGFDIDWGCQACTLEYCYSHQNEGDGILLMGSGEDKYRGFPNQSRYNICRYNVTENVIDVVETFEYGKVYNNVAVSEDTTLGVSGWPFGGWSSGGWPAHTEFFNNVLVSSGKGVPLWVDGPAVRQGNVFDHSLFWRKDGAGPLVKWAGQEHGKGFWEGTREGHVGPDVYTGLKAFRTATGREAHGVQGDPRLPGLGAGELGRLPLVGYRPQPGSPLLGAGRPVVLDAQWLAARRAYLTDTGAAALGIPMEPEPARVDYWGGALDGTPTIGLGGGSSMAGCVRPFGPRAPWNVPVAGLPRHPQSDHYARLLWAEAPASRPGNFNLTFVEYTYPVYYAGDATGEYPVRVSTNWGNLNGQRVPWNPNWQAAPGTDGQVIVLDPKTGREWDYWQVSFRDGVVQASNANLVPGDYRTKEDGFASSRGVGIQYLAMLVRPEEIAQGEIRHALSMPIRNTSGKGFVPPATKLEHPDRPDGIPEGMRFALSVTDRDIGVWLKGLPPELPEGMRRYARTLARALRDYGWFITDTSGGAHLQHEAWVSAGAKWTDLGLAPVEIGGKEYPRDLLDGLVTQERIYAIVPSDRYP